MGPIVLGANLANFGQECNSQEALVVQTDESLRAENKDLLRRFRGFRGVGVLGGLGFWGLGVLELRRCRLDANGFGGLGFRV